MAEPNMPWVIKQLQNFIAITKPRNLSGDGFITPQSGPSVPEAEVVAEQDVLEAVLDRFTPRWREENEADPNYAWHVHRRAAQRCLAQIERRQEVEEKLGSIGPRLSSDALHPWVWEAARPQWDSGHRADGVDAAARSLNSRLQQKVGRRDVSEAKLVQEAFSLKPPEPTKRRLRVVEDDGSETYRSLQEGVTSFGVGCFRAIRNPLAHLSPAELELTEQEALERLAALSLLARWIDQAAVHDPPVA